MSNLQRFEKEGIELVINTKTGEGFASISGYARMSGKNVSTISRRLKGLHGSKPKEVQVQTPGGLQGLALIDEKTIRQWMLKDNHEMAMQLMELGTRMLLHQLAGFEISSTAIAAQQSTEIVLPEAVIKQLTAIQEDHQKIQEDHQKILTALERIQQPQQLGLAIKRIEGLDRTIGQMAMDLTEQKQFFKGFGLGLQYLTELAKKAMGKFLEIEEKFESQSDPRTLIADQVLDEVQEKVKKMDSERAQKFKKIREQNEINRFLRDNP